MKNSCTAVILAATVAGNALLGRCDRVVRVVFEAATTRSLKIPRRVLDMLDIVKSGFNGNGAKPTLAEHAAEIRKLGKQTVENVIEIGRRLAECKRIVGYGYWLSWLESEFAWSVDTAENFIQLAALSDEIPKLSEFKIPLSGLYLLAKPSTPLEARAEIVERATVGALVTIADVKSAITKVEPKPEDEGSITLPEDMAEAEEALYEEALNETPLVERPPEDVGAADYRYRPLSIIEKVENAVRRAAGNAMLFLDPKDRRRLFKTLRRALSEIERGSK